MRFLLRAARRWWRDYGITLRQAAPISLESALSLISPLRRDAGVTNATSVISSGRRLKHRRLSKLLANEELGSWALDANTLNFLQQWMQSNRPRFVLEFGAGISTVFLAQLLSEMHPASKWKLYSIEQNEWQIQKTQSQIQQLGLETNVRLLHAPLREQEIEGQATLCYDLASFNLDDLLGQNQVQMVLVDGPAGDEGIRWGTLPLIQHYLKPGATFFLDDALRDGELDIARSWSQLPFIEIGNIHRMGKGLLEGTYNPKSA